TLNRPDKLNAFTATMMHELIAAFDQVDADDEVRAVVVTGAGRAFCAGADLSQGAATVDYDKRSDNPRAASQGRDDGSSDYGHEAVRRRRPRDAAHLRVPEAGD